jgi:hypothetical protein
MLFVALLALLPRTLNLLFVPFSLWGDEVLIMQRADNDLGAVIEACVANAEHPPLVALVMAAGRSAGLGETQQRLVPIVLGVATVVLLGHWAARRWGPAVGTTAASVAALSPFHVRYSQELRPYAYVMFFAVAALVLADRLESSSKRGAWAAVLAVTVALGFYSHNLFGLVLVPLLWGVVEDSVTARRWVLAPGRRWVLASFAVGFLAFVPWIVRIGARLAEREPRGGELGWGPREVLDRIQELTVDTVQGGPIVWGGVLGAVLVLSGGAIALRSAMGRAAFAGLLVGTVGVEVVLRGIDHWTASRYDSIGWLFVPVVVALALVRCAGRSRGLAVALGLALAVACIAGWGDYARHGRPDWRVVTEVVRDALRGTPESVEIWAFKGTMKDVRFYLKELRVRRALRARMKWRELKAHWPIRVPGSGRPALVIVREERLARDPAARAALAELRLVGQFEREQVRVYATPGLVAGWPNPPRTDPSHRADGALAALARCGGW